MSALVVADEIGRFTADERVLTRLYAFLSCFVWPVTALALWLGLLLLETVLGFDALPHWLRTLLVCAGLAALVATSRRHLRTLRMQDADLDAFYLSALAESPAPPTQPARQPLPPLVDALTDGERPRVVRLLTSLRDLVLAAPRLTAMAIFSWGRAITWDEATSTAAKSLFESLGATGGAWVACTAHPVQAQVMAGLERLGLIEHRRAGFSEIRLPPDIRRRYFPKDPSQAMYQGPPRRS
jgi:hypothetical protein